MDAQPTPPAPLAPTARAARALAPDVARGLVLLGIAVANVPFFLYGRELGILLKPVTDAAADPWVNALVATLADNRSYPLFALLFGYGLTQLLTREHARGTEWPEARRLLLRRNAWTSPSAPRMACCCSSATSSAPTACSASRSCC